MTVDDCPAALSAEQRATRRLLVGIGKALAAEADGSEDAETKVALAHLGSHVLDVIDELDERGS